MKILLSIICLSFSLLSFSQKENKIKELPGLDSLSNLVIVGQIDDSRDLFALEINLGALFNSYGISTKTSLNIVKQGASAKSMANDSIQNLLSTQGFDTYMLISVRGYDRRFKASTHYMEFNDALKSEHLFPLYRDDIVSVTFELSFYRNGELIDNQLVKIGTVGSQEAVLKKLNKKLARLIKKEWKH